jgi:spore germination protein KA
MVIVVAFTGISSFTLAYPEMYMPILIPRYVFIILGGTLGLLGLICGLIMLLINLTSKRSFGVPYMAPIMPIVKDSLANVLLTKYINLYFTRHCFAIYVHITIQKIS